MVSWVYLLNSNYGGNRFWSHRFPKAKTTKFQNVRSENTNGRAGKGGTKAGATHKNTKTDRQQSCPRRTEMKKNGHGRFAWGVPGRKNLSFCTLRTRFRNPLFSHFTHTFLSEGNEEDGPIEDVELYAPPERKSLTLGDFMGFWKNTHCRKHRHLGYRFAIEEAQGSFLFT